MSVIVAHFSDIHFGPDFDIEAWKGVRQHIERVRPQVIVVTGDFVDHPSPLHLLAAKVELHATAAAAGADLLVIPGNHDVYRSGLHAPFRRRSDWFERIFHGDTGLAERTLEEEVGEPLGFSRAYRDATPRSSAVALRLARLFGGAGSFARRVPSKPVASARVTRPGKAPGILFASIDSNEARRPWGLAAGAVARTDLQALDRELKASADSDLVRVALIHHHLLPIAYSHQSYVGGEPFMVLRNAGDVLDLLTRHRFDLVLHGHRHKQQFARLDFEPVDTEGYSLGVASAGSTAERSGNDGTKNCFNLITIETNGRVQVRSLTYGAANSPASNGGPLQVKVYDEPMASVKRRAHASAARNAPLRCEERHQSFAVSEAGNLEVVDRFRGHPAETGSWQNRREHAVQVPEDGWFVDALLELDHGSRNEGYKLVPPPKSDGTDRGPSVKTFQVEFPVGASRSDRIGYEVRYACGNGINMTRWEANERAAKDEEGINKSPDWNEEWVGADIALPTDRLVLELSLPPSLETIEPWLQCWRPSTYPAVAGTGEGGAPVRAFAIDRSVTEAEGKNLRYVPSTGLWRLTIDRPLPGYAYQLRWRTPDHNPDRAVRSQVLSQRGMLLASATRRSGGVGTTCDQEAEHLFVQAAEPLAQLLGSRMSGELRSIDMLAYRAPDQALVPVFSYNSLGKTAGISRYEVPLGRGIAGASFQQCRTIPWTDTDGSPFVRPYPPAAARIHDQPIRSTLAIPTFHRSEDGLKRPHPSSAIAVILFASSEHGSKVPDLFDPGVEMEDLLAMAKNMAHALTQNVLERLAAG